MKTARPIRFPNEGDAAEPSQYGKSNAPLFRDAVFAARQDQWLGEAIHIRPIAFSTLAIGFGVLATALVIFLIWGEYTRKIRASGYIVPNVGVIKVAAAQPGIVAELRVKEGQAIAAGDVLAVLNSERTTATGDAMAQVERQLELRRSALRSERLKLNDLYEQQRIAISARLANLRGEAAQITASLKLQQARIALTEKILTNQRKLHAEQFLSDMALQQKEQERLADLVGLESIKRNRTSLERDISSSEADLRALPVKHANELSAMDRSIATLEQDRIENESRREVFLKAPVAGLVTAILTDVGKVAAVGQPLLTLIPKDSDLQADVYLPTKSAGFVRVGTRALLQYQAFPYQKFGSQEAKVIQMSRVAVTGSELPFPAPPGASGDLYYIASLELPKRTVFAYGKEEPLQAGMGLDANLVLDTRTLLEWVFEPILAVTGNMVN